MIRSLAVLAVLGLVQAPAALAQLIDLNTASQEELESLPGIGEKMAQEILDNRPYGSVDELLQIPRFGEKRLARIRDLVTVGEEDSGAAEATGGNAVPGTAREAAATDWTPPAGQQIHQCWRCLERFCVEAGTESGVCPYCGVRWGRKGASP